LIGRDVMPSKTKASDSWLECACDVDEGVVERRYFFRRGGKRFVEVDYTVEGCVAAIRPLSRDQLPGLLGDMIDWPSE